MHTILLTTQVTRHKLHKTFQNMKMQGSTIRTDGRPLRESLHTRCRPGSRIACTHAAGVQHTLQRAPRRSAGAISNAVASRSAYGLARRPGVSHVLSSALRNFSPLWSYIPGTRRSTRRVMLKGGQTRGLHVMPRVGPPGLAAAARARTAASDDRCAKRCGWEQTRRLRAPRCASAAVAG